MFPGASEPMCSTVSANATCSCFVSFITVFQKFRLPRSDAVTVRQVKSLSVLVITIAEIKFGTTFVTLL